MQQLKAKRKEHIFWVVPEQFKATTYKLSPAGTFAGTNARVVRILMLVVHLVL